MPEKSIKAHVTELKQFKGCEKKMSALANDEHEKTEVMMTHTRPACYCQEHLYCYYRFS